MGLEYRVEPEHVVEGSWRVARRGFRVEEWIPIVGGFTSREAASKVATALSSEGRSLVRALGFEFREVVCDRDGKPV